MENARGGMGMRHMDMARREKPASLVFKPLVLVFVAVSNEAVVIKVIALLSIS